MRVNSTVGDLRESFCLKMNLNASEIRLLLNGERLEDNLTLHNLNLENGEVIDAFHECSGGGPPGKKMMLNSDKQILDALNDITDSDLSDDGNSEEIVQEKSLDEKLDEDSKENLDVTQDDNEIDKLSPINVPQLVTSPESTGKELPLTKDEQVFTFATLETKDSDRSGIIDDELDDSYSIEKDLNNYQDDVEFDKSHERKLFKDNNSNIAAEKLENSKKEDESASDDDNWIEKLKSKFVIFSLWAPSAASSLLLSLNSFLS